MDDSRKYELLREQVEELLESGDVVILKEFSEDTYLYNISAVELGPDNDCIVVKVF